MPQRDDKPVTRGKILIIAVFIVLVLVIGFAYIFLTQDYAAANIPRNENQSITQNSDNQSLTQGRDIQFVGDSYLNFSNGTASKIYLINSNAMYGTFEEDIYNGLARNYTVRKGDPCVIVDGTIRSDYDGRHVALLTAQLVDQNDQKVGNVTMSFKPYLQNYPAIVDKSVNNGTTTFKLFINYDKKDVKSYEVYVQDVVKNPPP